MPLYSFSCTQCGKKSVHLRRVANRNEPVGACDCCGGTPTRILDAPRIQADFAPYDCPITGKRIEGRKAHTENLAQHGCRILEPGENQIARKRLDAENDALDERIADTAADFASRLPVEDRVALEQALTGGLDIGFNRETGEKV